MYAEQASSLRVLPGAQELLDTLAGEHIPHAIATSGRLQNAQHALKLLKLSKDVPVVTRDDVRFAKPDPDLFLAAGDRLNAQPAHQWILEREQLRQRIGRKSHHDQRLGASPFVASQYGSVADIAKRLPRACHFEQQRDVLQAKIQSLTRKRMNDVRRIADQNSVRCNQRRHLDLPQRKRVRGADRG